MIPKQKQISLTLQILLWLWFGLITSFVSVNVVNIVKLETENKLLKEKIDTLESYFLLLRYQIRNK